MITEQQDYYLSLIERLRRLPVETEWLEYKSNNTDPQMIGEYISALSNSAALASKEKGYLIWGIDDATHEIQEQISVLQQLKRVIRNWKTGW